MACGKCNKNAENFKQRQSSRMPTKKNNIIKEGIEIPPNLTPDQRRTMMHKVANATKMKLQTQRKKQSVEEYNKKIQDALLKLSNKNDK